MFQKTLLSIGLCTFAFALSCEEVVTSEGGGIMSKKLRDAKEMGSDDSGRRVVSQAEAPRDSGPINFSLSKGISKDKEKISEAFGIDSIPENSAITCLCTYSANAGKILVKCKLPLQADWKTFDERPAANLKPAQCNAECSQMKESINSMISEEGVKTVWLTSICG